MTRILRDMLILYFSKRNELGFSHGVVVASAGMGRDTIAFLAPGRIRWAVVSAKVAAYTRRLITAFRVCVAGPAIQE